MNDEYFLVDTSAKSEIAKHAKKHPELPYLRVGVKGSGCQGFSYVFEYTDKTNDNDFVFDFSKAAGNPDPNTKVIIVVDKKSMKYLNESTLKYHKSLMKSEFRIENPQVKSSCGCGKSIDFK